MTNEEIIRKESNALMLSGILCAAHQIKAHNGNGDEVTIDIPEAIHTYQGWKELGYRVKKGEHAIAKFPIWKHTVRKTDDGDKESLFLKTAAWFRAAQVEKV